MKFYLVGFSLLVFANGQAFCQTANGPGGVENTATTSNLDMWWRADKGITLTGGVISAWADQTANGNNLSQASAARRPTSTTSAALNNQSVVRYGGSQFFNSAFSGPNVSNLTLFLVANGTSYQSLFRWQNNAGIYVVYPWEYSGAPRTFINSNDGGTATGIASGLVTSANNVGAARWKINTPTTGMQTWLNGAVNAQRTSNNVILPTQPFYSGVYNPGTSEFPNCDVGEMIVFTTALNDAQMIIVQNYLAGKFNITLSSNDYYTMDNAANGNFDFDVAGIGRVDASNIHNDSKGTGIVRMFNPSALGNNEFLFWGHDNATLLTTTSNVPTAAGVVQRFTRIWRVSKTGTVGTVTVSFDLTGLGPVVPSDLRLLIDRDNDGLFSDETVGTGGVINGAALISGSEYGFTGITLNNSERFTLATTNNVATPLPVELLGFSAACSNEHTVEFNWSTASESNNAFFSIEKSTDAIHWNTVLTLNGAGTTNEAHAYSGTDAFDPSAEIVYYRLVQNDFNGSANAYDIVAATCPGEQQLQVYPNPSTGIFNLLSDGQLNENVVFVYNSFGQQVKPAIILNDANRATMDFGQLGKGVYCIIHSANGKTSSQKIIVD